MAQIELSKGKSAIVDDRDHPSLSRFKWFYGCGGYAGRNSSRPSRKTILMHRFLLNPPNGMEVDHINRDKLDNRRSNLRIVTKSQNLHNGSVYRGTFSGLRGVTWVKARKRWQAKIYVDKNIVFLGHYKIKEEAAKAYDRAKSAYGYD